MNQRSIVKSPRVSLALRILLGLLVLALLLLISYIYYTGGWKDTLLYYRYFFNPRRLKALVASFGPYAWLIYIAMQILQVVIAPVPGEVTGFVGGLLFGVLPGTILATIGLTLGSIVAFVIARLLGAAFVHRIIKKEYIDKFDYFITHKGLYLTWILFIMPGFPKDSLCYLLGLTRMRYLDFILINLLGRLPGTLILVLQGSAVREAHYQEFSIYLIVSAVLVSVLYLGRNQIIHFFSRVTHGFRRRGDKLPVQTTPRQPDREGRQQD
jgi:uncharacterized membrane protein YdjX (TVP38/TMEM64 family)